MKKHPTTPTALPASVATFPVPGALGQLLDAGPLRAVLAVYRADGGPVTEGDLVETQRTLDAWAASDATRPPALPGPSILAAVAAGGGLRPGSRAAKAAEALGVVRPTAAARVARSARRPKRGSSR